MAGSTSAQRALEREKNELRARVGQFVRERREQLGLSQGDIIRELGYVSRNSVSNIETGREGLPAKRIFAWADILKVPRDAFYCFVTGDTTKIELGREHSEKSANAENELLNIYRKLSSKQQRKVRDFVRELIEENKAAKAAAKETKSTKTKKTSKSSKKQSSNR